MLQAFRKYWEEVFQEWQKALDTQERKLLADFKKEFDQSYDRIGNLLTELKFGFLSPFEFPTPSEFLTLLQSYVIALAPLPAKSNIDKLEFRV